MVNGLHTKIVVTYCMTVKIRIPELNYYNTNKWLCYVLYLHYELNCFPFSALQQKKLRVTTPFLC